MDNMGLGNSRHNLEEKKKDGAELVDCDHHVSVADINRVYHEKKTDMSENSQKIFTKSVELVAKTDDYIMRDCELTMRENSRLYVIFFAGSLANKYSVTVREEEEKGAEVIDCGSFISVADINNALGERPYLPESSKKIFRRAAKVVAKCEDYILRNCELKLVDGNHLYIIFYAGSRGNKYLVIVNDNDDVEDICKARSFKRVLWEGACSFFTNIQAAFGYALNYVTRLAIEGN